MLDASQIVPGLYVGSAPPPGDYTNRFDVIVLTADEYQPGDEAFPGVRVRHYPFDDHGDPSERDYITAWEAASAVARDMRRGRRVLVTCAMGRNRSGLVAAIALHRLTRMPGSAALRLVRSRRVDQLGVPAISNEAFQGFLRTL